MLTITFPDIYISLGFYIAFNTVQVISRWVVLWAEETSIYVHQGSVLQTAIRKQLTTFPHKVWGLNCRPQRWEASVLPLPHQV